MQIEKLVGVTVDITNMVNEDGTPFVASKSNLYVLYKANPWLRAQVLEFLEDRRNFFKP